MNFRSISKAIESDLATKLVLLSGPRQVGKTTVSKSFLDPHQTYLNFDSAQDRKIIESQSWDQRTQLLILDEIHKMKNWKRWLKGVYDTKNSRLKILVTGSSNLELMRKVGDSLAGRYFHHRLLPLSVKEVESLDKQQVLSRLMDVGGFPEPYFSNDVDFSNRWRSTHIDQIIREDLLDLEVVKGVRSIQLLVDLLAEQVGSSVSYNSLARSLEVSPHTIKRWIGLLEMLYVIFVVTPYSKKISKSILKEPKIYFFDTGRVAAGEAVRLENTVAVHLLKRNYFLEDTKGIEVKLHYLKNKDRNEVDFLTVNQKQPELMVEVKTSDQEISKSLKLFSENLKPKRKIQTILKLEKDFRWQDFEIVPTADFLNSLET